MVVGSALQRVASLAGTTAGTTADKWVVLRVDSWVVSMAAMKACLMADWTAVL